MFNEYIYTYILLNNMISEIFGYSSMTEDMKDK